MIDLRSDTVTNPTRRMLESILEAPLGDDVFEEDETTKKLEKLAARLTGFEASLLVTSGTQANLTNILAHTKRGDEVIYAGGYNSPEGIVKIVKRNNGNHWSKNFIRHYFHIRLHFSQNGWLKHGAVTFPPS